MLVEVIASRVVPIAATIINSTRVNPVSLVRLPQRRVSDHSCSVSTRVGILRRRAWRWMGAVFNTTSEPWSMKI